MKNNFNQLNEWAFITTFYKIILKILSSNQLNCLKKLVMRFSLLYIIYFLFPKDPPIQHRNIVQDGDVIQIDELILPII